MVLTRVPSRYDDASHFNREYKRRFGEPPIRDVEQLQELNRSRTLPTPEGLRPPAGTFHVMQVEPVFQRIVYRLTNLARIKFDGTSVLRRY